MKYKILFLSEIIGSGGGGIASERIIDSFNDYKTKVISLTNEKNLFFIVKYLIIKFYYRLVRYFITNSLKFNFNSFNPDIGVYSLKDIDRKINDFKPDIIIVTWIEFLISLKTLYQLKTKYNSNIIFVAMDNHLFTGGCRYVNECNNYKNHCNNCYALKKNFRHISVKNFKFYRDYFNKLNPMFMLPSNHSINFFKSLELKFKYFEFDYWPIQFEKMHINKKDDFISQKKDKIIGKDIVKQKKIIICPIQKFDEPRKGWNYLYYSIMDYQNQLSDNEINIHFLFIGKIEKHHKELFKNFRVSYNFYDYLNRKSLEELYSISDFGVVPSIQEWAAISTNEMMTFGLPVINFKTGSSKNIIIDGKNGFIVDLKNVYELSEKLKFINYMENSKMDDMKSFTKNFAFNNFQPTQFKEKLLQLHENKN